MLLNYIVRNVIDIILIHDIVIFSIPESANGMSDQLISDSCEDFWSSFILERIFHYIDIIKAVHCELLANVFWISPSV